MSQPYQIPAPALFRALAFCLILALAPCLPPADAHAAEGQPKAPTDTPANAATDADAPGSKDSLGQIWTARSGDVDAIVDEAAVLRERAEDLAKPLTDQIRQARMQFTRLSSLYQASRGHPTEQLTLVQQMHTLLDMLKKQTAPLESIAVTLGSRLDEISALQKDMEDVVKTGSDIALSQADEQGRALYNDALAEARKKLLPVSRRVGNLLAPAKSTIERIEGSLKNVDSGLVGVWEQYYVTSSENSLGALAQTPSLLADWMSSLTSRAAFAYPQTLDEWGGVLKNFVSAAFVMALLAAFAVRGATALPERWATAVTRIIRGSWVLVALGLSLLAASTNQSGGIYFGFVLAGSLIIIAGIAALSWRLRIAVVPELVKEPSPLFRLYVFAAIGVLMLFSDLPTRILGIVWGLSTITFLYLTLRTNRQLKKETDLPLLERLTYGSAFWFALASLVVAVMGYARLSILLFIVLFALANTVTLGSALMDLCTILANLAFNKEEKPVRNALVEAAGIPLAWAFSLLCTMPWIWAIPGARYLLEHMMSKDYTVGEATFDFSKIVIIVMLFFLFRSFISLGTTSLDHLPERLPSMEKGVIPPLRTLFTYALWAIFAIVCLGMVGVNFTSLAVVAGGLSVGIGFGMQNLFNNLVSGLMLIFGRTILVGDYVDVAGASGTVRAISIRSTTIETPEKALIYVPNSAIMSGQFTNWTRESSTVRRSLNIGVAYGSDTALVTRLLYQAAKENDDIMIIPAPAVYFSNFGNSSLDFTLNVFMNFNTAVKTMSDLRMNVEKLFAEHNIDIPFPQLTLHMSDAPAAAIPQQPANPA